MSKSFNCYRQVLNFESVLTEPFFFLFFFLFNLILIGSTFFADPFPPAPFFPFFPGVAGSSSVSTSARSSSTKINYVIILITKTRYFHETKMKTDKRIRCYMFAFMSTDPIHLKSTVVKWSKVLSMYMYSFLTFYCCSCLLFQYFLSWNFK